jgi:hypothetical protein
VVNPDEYKKLSIRCMPYEVLDIKVRSSLDMPGQSWQLLLPIFSRTAQIYRLLCNVDYLATTILTWEIDLFSSVPTLYHLNILVYKLRYTFRLFTMIRKMGHFPSLRSVPSFFNQSSICSRGLF